jgi:hypothetical protein
LGTLFVNAKGHVILGKDLVQHLGVSPGGKIVVSKLPNGTLEIKDDRATGKISDVFGLLKTKGKGKPLSIDEMNSLIARGWNRNSD